jgi:PAS domain S-box-containing protein
MLIMKNGLIFVDNNKAVSYTLYITLFICLLFGLSGHAYGYDILLINSYHKGLSWTDRLTDSFLDELVSQEYNIHIEYMDTKRHRYEYVKEDFYQLLENKWESTGFDIVVVSDNTALEFVRTHNAFFGSVPVVFCGINNFSPELLTGIPSVTGVVEQSDPVSTFEIMVNLQPGIKRCLVIGDDTVTGRNEMTYARQQLGGSLNNVEIDYITDTSISNLLEKVSAFDPIEDSILLTVFNRDSEGNYFDYEDSAKLISATAKCPIYGLWDFYLGCGVIGGKMVSASQQGQKAGQLVKEILRGSRNPNEIPVNEKDINRILFDYHSISEANIKLEDLPLGAFLVNHSEVIYKTEFSEKIKVGVLANKSYQQCLDQWSETIDYLTLKVPEYYFELVPLEFDEIEPAASNEEVDFLITNPAQFIVLYNLYRMPAIASITKLFNGKSYDEYGSVVITRSDREDISSFAEIKNKTFLAVDKNSFGGWLMALNEFMLLGIDPYKDFKAVEFASSHDRVVEAVLSGQYDAGCVRSGVLEQSASLNPDILTELKVIRPRPPNEQIPFIVSTQTYPEWPIAAVDPERKRLNNMVATALITMPEDCSAAEKSQCGGWTIPHNYRKVNNCLMQIGIRPYEGYGEIHLKDVLWQYRQWLLTLLMFLALLAGLTFYSSVINKKLKLTGFALAKSEKRLALTLRSIGDGVISTDENGEIVEMNPVAEKLTRWDFKDAKGAKLTKVFNIVNNKTGKPVENPSIKAMKTAEIVDLAIDTNLIAKDGQMCHIADSASPILDQQGDVIGSVLVFRDVSESYRNNQLIKEREQRFDQIAQQSLEVVWEVNKEGLYTYISRSSKDVFGYDPDEMIGEKYFYDLCPEDKKEQFKTKAFEVFAKRESFKGVVNEVISKDGSSMWLSTNGLPVVDEAGNLVGYRGLDSDITEMKKARREIERNNTQLNALLDSIPDVIFFKDKQGVYLGCNPEFERFTGMTRENIIGKTDFDIFDRELAEFFREKDANMLRDHEIKKNEETVTYPDGSIVLFDTTKSPLINSLGETIGVAGISRDITATNKAQQELIDANERISVMIKKVRDSDKAKGEFLANMSHEIRTPMNAIIGFGEMLKEEDLTPQQTEYVDIIRSEGGMLLNLINDILDFSKIESGKLQIDLVDCSIDEILNSIYVSMSPLAKQRGLEFKVNKNTDLPEVVCTDPTRLKQCLINLVNNAIKFTHKGYVHINVFVGERPDSNMVLFYVEDTGIGISEDKQQDIFGMFTQAESSTTRKYGGSGLGLAITKSLANMLGGDLTVKSAEGKGSVFTLTIKVGETGQRCSEEPVMIDENISLESLGPLHGSVLVADDARTNQVLIKKLLERCGLDVTIAENGRDAFEKVCEHKFDIIFMDIQMPVMDGYQSVGLIRERGIDVPIIALTANAMKSDRDKCIAAGCDDYIPKPINRKRLAQVLKNIYKP